MTRVSFTVPVKTVNPGNGQHGHWTTAAARRKAEHRAVAYRFPPLDIAPVVFVKLIRISKGELDDDAVPGACKAIRDAIAAKLRLDDACRLVSFSYSQEKGEPGVRVEMDVPTKGETP